MTFPNGLRTGFDGRAQGPAISWLRCSCSTSNECAPQGLGHLIL